MAGRIPSTAGTPCSRPCTTAAAASTRPICADSDRLTSTRSARCAAAKSEHFCHDLSQFLQRLNLMGRARRAQGAPRRCEVRPRSIIPLRRARFIKRGETGSEPFGALIAVARGLLTCELETRRKFARTSFEDAAGVQEGVGAGRGDYVSPAIRPVPWRRWRARPVALGGTRSRSALPRSSRVRSLSTASAMRSKGPRHPISWVSLASRIS
jgi:hypothetical protein